jgi:hypothetical protein
MKICQCGNSIPNRIKIDGREYVTRNRTKCLLCSPFKKVRIPTSKEKKRVAAREMYQNFKRTHGFDPIWKRRQERRQYIIDLLGGSCQICGYNICLKNLCFHHMDESTKSMNIGTHGFQFGTSKIFLELLKCVMLCHNCHGEVHDGIIPDDKLLLASMVVKEKVSPLLKTGWPVSMRKITFAPVV